MKDMKSGVERLENMQQGVYGRESNLGPQQEVCSLSTWEGLRLLNHPEAWSSDFLSVTYSA